MTPERALTPRAGWSGPVSTSALRSGAEAGWHWRPRAFALEVTKQFSRIYTHRCRYKDGELNVGENSCIDRCTSKYWQATGIVGQMLGAQGQMQ